MPTSSRWCRAREIVNKERQHVLRSRLQRKARQLGMASRLAGGGAADFRGTHNRTYCLVSGPDLAVNAHFENRTFVRYGGQLIHGTFITIIFISVRSPGSGTLVRVAVLAEQTRSFRVANDTLAPGGVEKHRG